MIEVDRRVPQMSSGSGVAPKVCELPGMLHLAFLVGTGDASAVLTFTGVRDWHYGYPNDEALDAHPLYGLGLKPYPFHVTPLARHGERAWVATFHDGTLTVFAADLKVVSSGHPDEPGNALVNVLGAGVVRDLGA